MLVYLPTASEDIQNQAFEYANTMLSDPKQLDLIPATAPCHALLGNPEGRPSTYSELREMQLEEEKKTGYTTHDFASVTCDVVVGLMGYSTLRTGDNVFGYGPWLGQSERVGFTFERDMIGIYDEVLNNTTETWVSLFCGELNEDRLKQTFREKDGLDGFSRHVVNRYEKKTLPIKMVYATLSGKILPTRSVILRGRLK